jgi:5-methylcytosine-specific restriction endonuclease McrA
MSFSIDHIIPRSQQGSHSFDNLRPAHLECNSLRGDKPA